MAALHEALSTLGPLTHDSLPSSESEEDLAKFLQRAFEAATLAVDSVPPPPAVPPNVLQQQQLAAARSRSNTTTSANSASSSSYVIPSGVRSAPPPAEVQALQKEWKDLKVATNAHDIKVYKLSAKDGNGAWFARRSVHEGIGFNRFRKGLRREFEETLGTGDDDQVENGNSSTPAVKTGVRGIACEKRIDKRVAKGFGTMDLNVLCGLFGPVTARDFVELCMSSSRSYHTSPGKGKGREFTLISRPITHPEAPPRNGFVRGFYESIEYIREIPAPKTVVKSRSSMSLPAMARKSVAERAVRGRARSHTASAAASPVRGGPGNIGVVFEDSSKLPNGKSEEESKEAADDADSHYGDDDEDEDGFDEESESHPVEWIMITRSNPGGSVPRFMVEKGTPGSIVKDAEKFLSWAIDKEHHDEASDDELHPDDDDHNDNATEDTRTSDKGSIDVPDTTESGSQGGHTNSSRQKGADSNGVDDEDDDGDETSVLSFQTASGGCDDDDAQSTVSSTHTHSTANVGSPSTISKLSENSRTDSMTSLNMQRRKLTEKIAKQREKDEQKQKKELAKEEERKRKLEEKHERERIKRQEKFLKEQERSEEKMRREAEKIAERKRKLELKDERLRFEREKEELRGENNLLRKEKSILIMEVEALKGEIEKLKAAAANDSSSCKSGGSGDVTADRDKSTPSPTGSRNGNHVEPQPAAMREASPIPDN